MKIAITGYLGMLGSEIYQNLRKDNKVLGLDIDKVDLRDFEKAELILEKFSPDVIIHTAAMTDVDGCERSPEDAEIINHILTQNLSGFCGKNKIKLVYISTDYVFDGEKEGFYKENDITHPVSVYGWTKLRGEKAVKRYKRNLIIRIAWLFGKKRRNFVSFVIDGLKAGKELRIVNDQFGTPTYTADLSKAVKFLIDKNASGIFHSANDGECSWLTWAQFIKKAGGFPGRIIPIPSSEFPRPAPRPRNSRLENSRLRDEFEYLMPDWRNATRRFLKELGY